MGENQTKKMIRAGSRTYFMDVRTAANGKRFLAIAESRYKGEGQPHERQTIRVFPEHASEFLEELTSMIWRIK